MAWMCKVSVGFPAYITLKKIRMITSVLLFELIMLTDVNTR